MNKAKVERCWLCGRTAEEVLRDDVSGEAEQQLEDGYNIFERIGSEQWVNHNNICVVCMDILEHLMIEKKVLFEGEEIHATLDR